MNRLRQISGLTVLLAVLLAWVVSLVSAYDPVTDVHHELASLAPSAEHWLGTDHLGRDVAWRLVTASEAFVGPGLAACLVALGVGVGGGALSGWRGGWVEHGLRYGFSVVASVPRFVLVLLAAIALSPSVWTLALFGGLAFAPTVGEAVHERVERFRSAEFVLAAEAHGVPPWRVLLWHILWVNCGPLVARQALQVFATFLLLETTLSFLGGLDADVGFGVQEPQPSWGNMLAFGWRRPEANPLATWAPGLAIWSVLGAAALLGRSVADPDA